MTTFNANATFLALLADLDTLVRMTFPTDRPCSEGDVRAMSAILRRWLVENLLTRLTHKLEVSATMTVLGNEAVLKAIEADPTIRYFLTGGVSVAGRPVMAIYESSAPADQAPRLPIAGGLKKIEVSPGQMLKQKRVFHDGRFFDCKDIIQFTANKLGGVHLDFRRKPEDELLERAAQFFTFGGPLNRLRQQPPGELYLALEPNGTEVLSGFHIEIIAAAASLVSVKFNGEPLVQLKRARSLALRLRSLWHRRPSPMFDLHDFAEPASD